MSTAAARHTSEDLLVMPDDGRTYELVKDLVENNKGFESGRFGG